MPCGRWHGSGEALALQTWGSEFSPQSQRLGKTHLIHTHITDLGLRIQSPEPAVGEDCKLPSGTHTSHTHPMHTHLTDLTCTHHHMYIHTSNKMFQR